MLPTTLEKTPDDATTANNDDTDGNEPVRSVLLLPTAPPPPGHRQHQDEPDNEFDPNTLGQIGIPQWDPSAKTDSTQYQYPTEEAPPPSYDNDGPPRPDWDLGGPDSETDDANFA
jgi:hypothetical protein